MEDKFLSFVKKHYETFFGCLSYALIGLLFINRNVMSYLIIGDLIIFSVPTIIICRTRVPSKKLGIMIIISIFIKLVVVIAFR